MKMLDLFCGRWGWSRAFAKRGWGCIGVDLRNMELADIPDGCRYSQLDVLTITPDWIVRLAPDFICASSPCEEFSVHGMKHFHPDPAYPFKGIQLFNHTRNLCEASGVPYVMENVRPAQSFVGSARHHCGPYYLWGSGVPMLIGWQNVNKRMSQQRKRDENGKRIYVGNDAVSKKERRANSATIPIELANCVAEYAERICKCSSH